MIDAGGMAEFHGIDELQQHILDSLGVTWDTSLEDILVQIAKVTVLENEECITGRFEGVDAANDVVGAGKVGFQVVKDGVIMAFLTVDGTGIVG